MLSNNSRPPITDAWSLEILRIVATFISLTVEYFYSPLGLSPLEAEEVVPDPAKHAKEPCEVWCQASVLKMSRPYIVQIAPYLVHESCPFVAMNVSDSLFVPPVHCCRGKGGGQRLSLSPLFLAQLKLIVIQLIPESVIGIHNRPSL